MGDIKIDRTPYEFRDDKERAAYQQVFDRAVARLYAGDLAGEESKFMHFYASYLCTLEIVWCANLGFPGATNGITMYLDVPTVKRITEGGGFLDDLVYLILHEVKHGANLHGLRQHTRDNEVWGIACDVRINNDLDKMGLKLKHLGGIHEPYFDRNGIAAEENIYDLLCQPPPPSSGGGGNGGGGGKPTEGNQNGNPQPRGGNGQDNMTHGDVLPVEDRNQEAQAISKVVQAIESTERSQGAGSVPGSVKERVGKLIKPFVNWEAELREFHNQLLDKKRSFQRRNRRHNKIIMPRSIKNYDRLDDLVYFMDVSGSVGSKELIRFNSELNFIHKVLRPEVVTVVMFDTKIQKIIEFKEGDEISGIEVLGRGGTNLQEVADYIEKHECSAAIVLTDLYCSPMRKLNVDCAVFWACVNNPNANVPYGKLIHMPVNERD